MINFSTLQGLTIPEGVVTQMADASGRVLWSAVKPATITIDDSFAGGGLMTVSIDGVSYSDTTITVPVGTVIEISAKNLYCGGCKGTYGTAYVYINDECVASQMEGISYSYIVTGNATIRCAINPSLCRKCSSYAYDALIYITETPVTFTINGTEYSAPLIPA